MSVFSQYVPHTFAAGQLGHPSRRGGQAGGRLDRPLLQQLPGAIIAWSPGSTRRGGRVGLTGGHIFQGECLPALHVEQSARSTARP